MRGYRTGTNVSLNVVVVDPAHTRKSTLPHTYSHHTTLGPAETSAERKGELRFVMIVVVV